MRLTPATVAEECDHLHERAPVVLTLLNQVRTDLGAAFGTEVGTVSEEQYHAALDAVFADGDRAVNVAALAGLLRNIDVAEDYPGFVVDEILGRELAAMIAGPQPRRLLAEATFHYADIHHHPDEGEDVPGTAGTDEPAGLDDLDAALAAGFQTRLPGWEWTETESPFAVE